MSAIIAYGGSPGNFIYDRYLSKLIELSNSGVNVGISLQAKNNAVKDGIVIPPDYAPSERVRQLKLKYPELELSNIQFIDENSSREEFLSCEVLFIPGGSPEWLYHRLINQMQIRKEDLVNKVLITDSASTMILFENVIFPSEFSLNEGLGIMPGVNIPHYKEFLENTVENSREMHDYLMDNAYPDSIILMNEQERFVIIDRKTLDARQLAILQELYPKETRLEGELLFQSR